MWVDLQIKYLCTLGTKDEIKKKLGKLPKTLEATYERIYKTILEEDEEGLEVVKRALMWVMCSQRPLASQEWARVSYWPKSADEDTGAYPLLKMCRNLVTLDSKSQVVRFAHLSVQEYLEKLDDFTAEKPNSMAASVCLSALLSEETSTPSPFGEASRYHVAYWMEHVSRCTGSQDVLDLVRSFLGTPVKPGQAYRNWLQIVERLNSDWDSRNLVQPWAYQFLRTVNIGFRYREMRHLLLEPWNPLFAVCYFRLGMGIQDFWTWDAFDIDSRNSRGETLLHIASLAGNEQIVKSLLENGADANTPYWEISPDFENPLTAAIKNRQARIAVTLLDHGGSVGFPGIGWYRNTLEFASEHGDENVVKAIIERDCNTKVTEMVLAAAARNGEHACEVLKTLLVRDPSVQITEAVLSAAAGNYRKEVLEMLLAGDHTIQVTEAVLSAAADNSNEKVLEMLLAGDHTIQITEAVLSAAAKNYIKNVLEMLLTGKYTIQITEAVLLAAAANNLRGEVLEMLLTGDHTIQITEAVLSAVARGGSEKALKILLAGNHTIQITEAVLLAATQNFRKEVLEMLLVADHTIQITEAVLSAVARGYYTEKALKMLLAGDHTIQITEAVLLAAAENSNEKAMEMLLASGYTIQITEAVLSVAAENYNKKVLEMLLSGDHTIQTTEAVLLAVARNGNERTLEMLLAGNHTFQITEAVLSVATRNRDDKVLKMLLAGDHTIQITETVFSAAVGCKRNEKALEMLLASGHTIQITEAVLSAAVESSNYGDDIFGFILASEHNVEITEAILTIAVGCSTRGVFVRLFWILARNVGNTNVTVNPTALKASAYFASSLLFHKLLGKCDRSSILGGEYLQVMYAAVQGGDRNILRSLLELGGECLGADEHGWTLQMMKHQSDFMDEMLPARAPNRTHHRSEAPKLLEAGIGHCAPIQMSEPTALDISRLPECIKLQCDGSYMFYSGKWLN